MHSNRLFQSRSRVFVFGSLFSLLLIGLAAALLVGPASARAQDQPVNPSPAYDPANVALPTGLPLALVGRPYYQENCAPCHGAEGLGNGPTAKDLSGPPTAFADAVAVRDLSPAQLFHTTKYGRMEKMMPPWGNRMDDEQIWNAVAYAWSLHTKESAVAAGKVLYDESCARCHGAEGMGNGPDAEGELSDFSDLQYALFSSQSDWDKGWQATHPEIGQEWTVDEQANTLEYMRTFSMRPPWVSPYVGGTGVLTGTVIQGTAGGASVAGLPVALEAYIGFDQIATFTSTVGADGTFAFDKLDTDPNIGYLASVVADGVSYSSDFMALSPISPTLATTLAVYGTTDDPSGLRVNRSHWIIDQQPGALIVGEIYTFGNSGDRTYLGKSVENVDEPLTVGLRLPAAAEQVTFENGELGQRFRQVGDVIYDTMPVLPGEATRQIIVRYAVPYQGTSLDLKRETLYPVDELTLLVADLPQLKVDVPAMEAGGLQDMGGQGFQLWRKSAFEPQTIEVKMQGLLERDGMDPRAVAGDPAAGTAGTAALASTAPPLEPWVAWVMAGLVGAGLLAAIGVAVQRGSVRSAHSRQELGQLRDNLIEQIAQLDDQYAMGELSQSDWSQQRAQMKVQLVDVMQHLESGAAQNRRA